MKENTTRSEITASKDNLWTLPAAPALWALHFFLAYATAALWCGKLAGPEASTAAVQLLVGVYTLVVLPAVGYIGYRGYQAHRSGGSSGPHDFDSVESRHRFLGLAKVLLASLSAVAILYTAIAAWLIERCAG